MLLHLVDFMLSTIPVNFLELHTERQSHESDSECLKPEAVYASETCVNGTLA